jgi:hypothetical protein
MRIERTVLRLLLAAGLATACESATDPRTATDSGGPADFQPSVTQQLRFQAPFTGEIAAEDNACTGEAILLTGKTTYHETDITDTQEDLDQGLDLHYVVQLVVDATGVGAVTGTQYAIHEVLQNLFDSPNIPAPQSTLTFQDALHAISQGPGGNLLIRAVFHVSVLPSGEFKVTRDGFSAVCQG